MPQIARRLPQLLAPHSVCRLHGLLLLWSNIVHMSWWSPTSA